MEDNNVETERVAIENNNMKTVLSKMRTYFQKSEITVEPVLFINNMATQMVFFTSLDLMEHKSCLVNLNNPSYVCSDLSNFEAEETEVQSMVSEYLMWRSILESAIKLLSVPLLGWWADTRGVRGPLIFCLVLLMFEALSHMTNSLASEWPLEAILTGSFFYGLSGGSQATLMLCFLLLANKTKIAKRTRRMGILDGFYYLGSPLGLALAPPIFNSLGYSGVFAIAALFYLLIACYVLVLLQEDRLTILPEEEVNEVHNNNQRCSNFGIENITNSFYVTFKKQPNRKYILILILAMLFDSFVIWGESSVKYLFTQKALDWDYNQYSHYGTTASLLTAVGALILVPLLTKLSLADTLIGIIGAVARCLERVMYVFAAVFNYSWFMYLGCVIGSASPLAPTAIRAHLSKLDPDDVGQIYAVMAVGESFLPFATAPIYTKLYNKTADTFSASFYILSILVNAMMIICFLYVHNSLKKRTKRSNEQK